MTTECLALLYSDGTIGTLSSNDLAHAKREREFVDQGERSPEHLTKIVRVSFEIVEIIHPPAESS